MGGFPKLGIPFWGTHNKDYSILGSIGGGGVGGVSRLRFPPDPHLRSSRFSRHPRLRQAPTRRFAKNRNLRGLGGFCGEKAPGPWWAGPQALGARAPSPLETWPTGPWGLDPAEFLWAAPSPFWRPGQQAAVDRLTTQTSGP